MGRLKSSTPVQVNVRMDRKLLHELETAAEEHGLNLSQEIRLRLKRWDMIRQPSVKRASKVAPDVNS